jgi:hypothetical protein
VKTATKSRGTSRRGSGCGRPWPCKRCRQPILWATVHWLNGSVRKVPVNADPVAHGDLEYVRGSVLRPVLRQLDRDQVARPREADRYVSHLRFCRLEGATGATPSTPGGRR